MFEKLFYVREEAELTQKELSEIFHVDRSLIAKWENNQNPIPLKHLNTYSNYFNVSLDYLTGLSKKKGYSNQLDLDKIVIGQNIKRIRKEHNLTLRSLASILHTSASTLSAYETGKVLILTSFLYELCLKFHISMDEVCNKK